jgi:hypothetical protein
VFETIYIGVLEMSRLSVDDLMQQIHNELDLSEKVGRAPTNFQKENLDKLFKEVFNNNIETKTKAQLKKEFELQEAILIRAVQKRFSNSWKASTSTLVFLTLIVFASFGFITIVFQAFAKTL